MLQLAIFQAIVKFGMQDQKIIMEQVRLENTLASRFMSKEKAKGLLNFVICQQPCLLSCHSHVICL